MQSNQVTIRLFLDKIYINNILSAIGCDISNILCEYKINVFDIMYGNNVRALHHCYVSHDPLYDFMPLVCIMWPSLRLYATVMYHMTLFKTLCHYYVSCDLL